MTAMDINKAVALVDAFVEDYRTSHAGRAPIEAKVNPSGDEKDVIKLWLNFGPDATEDKLPALEEELRDALLQAHPEVKEFTFRVRSQAF
jgi:hypothetical protein